MKIILITILINLSLYNFCLANTFFKKSEFNKLKEIKSLSELKLIINDKNVRHVDHILYRSPIHLVLDSSEIGLKKLPETEREKSLEYLIKLKADINKPAGNKDYHGLSPIEYALKNKLVNCVDILIRNGCELKSKVNLSNNSDEAIFYTKLLLLNDSFKLKDKDKINKVLISLINGGAPAKIGTTVHSPTGLTAIRLLLLHGADTSFNMISANSGEIDTVRSSFHFQKTDTDYLQKISKNLMKELTDDLFSFTPKPKRTIVAMNKDRKVLKQYFATYSKFIKFINEGGRPKNFNSINQPQYMNWVYVDAYIADFFTETSNERLTKGIIDFYNNSKEAEKNLFKKQVQGYIEAYRSLLKMTKDSKTKLRKATLIKVENSLKLIK